MGLFSKKTCNLCGAEIKILSGKKLKDGNHICKECCNKTSAWFDDYSGSTIDDIKNQISAREENLKKLDSFETTHCYGKFSCILIDDNKKCFVALPETSDSLFGNQRLVTDISDIKDKNPDIIEYSQITDIKIDPRVTLSNSGEQNEGGPKRYRYACNFFVDINLDHPYIRCMRLSLNESALFITCSEQRKVTTYADQMVAYFTGLKKQDYDIENNPDFRRIDKLEDIILNKLKLVPDYSFGFKVEQHRNWNDIKRYQSYILQCEQIKRVLENK